MSDSGFVDNFTVAIEGFSPFEREALASFFRLAAQRSPAFHQVDEVGMADFLIADGDHAASVAAVRRGQRLDDTVFIGAKAPDGAAAWLPRPIDPMHVLRELEGLVEMRLTAPEPPSEMMDLDPMEIDTLRGGLDDLPRTPRAEPEREPPKATAVARPPVPPPAPAPRGGGGREVLVVEDSAIARQFLKRRLTSLGYRVHECASGEAAMDMLSRRTFGMAFLDIRLGPPGSIDGLQLCQRLKQRGAQNAGLRTVVVMVTGLDGATDRVRGSLAGCDAYLTKPLHEAEFIATLLQVDPAFEWNVDAPTSA
ncbi:response regulator [Variovorax sp. YR752]|uniref:response regulator transcription factor n=1 Tax=Variovorax sp. YR752 TaxID=1884383 RepID=UPI003137F836